MEPAFSSDSQDVFSIIAGTAEMKFDPYNENIFATGFYVATPTMQNQAANKNYVDNTVKSAVGTINTALDTINGEVV